jgi:hypothetical protein
VNSLGESAENQVFRVRKPSVQKNKCFVCVYAGNKSSVNTPSVLPAGKISLYTCVNPIKGRQIFLCRPVFPETLTGQKLVCGP